MTEILPPISVDEREGEGEWEIKTSIFCNGKAVGFIDAHGPTYEFAVDTVVTGLERREFDLEVGGGE